MRFSYEINILNSSKTKKGFIEAADIQQALSRIKNIMFSGATGSFQVGYFEKTNNFIKGEVWKERPREKPTKEYSFIIKALSKTTDSGSRVFDRLFKVLDEKGSRYYTGEIKVTGEFNGAKQTTTFYPKIWAISKEAAKQRLKQQISKNWKNFKISGILKETSKTQDTAPFKVLDNAKQLRTKYKISYDAYYTAGVKLNNGKYSRSETEKRVSEVIATSKQEALQKLKNGLKKAERAGYRYSNFKIIKIEREPVFEKLSEQEKLKLLLGERI